MISRVLVKDPALSVVPWWKDVAALRGLAEIPFKEGLNILWGRNGSGKSTILRMLAKLTHCDQGGVSKVTRTSLSEFFPWGGDPPKLGILLEQDGQAVLSLDASKEYGTAGKSFDDDFFELGMRRMLARGSSGQVQGFWLSKMMKSRKAWPEVEWTLSEAGCNDVWAGWIAQVREKMFAAQIPPGPKTILVDEPDRSLDLDAQALVWRDLPLVAAEGYQIIAASHSAFARDIPGAHYIELTPGYLESCRKLGGPK